MFYLLNLEYIAPSIVLQGMEYPLLTTLASVCLSRQLQREQNNYGIPRKFLYSSSHFGIMPFLFLKTLLQIYKYSDPTPFRRPRFPGVRSSSDLIVGHIFMRRLIRTFRASCDKSPKFPMRCQQIIRRKANTALRDPNFCLWI